VNREIADRQPTLCECGCGEPAPIAKRTYSSRGYMKGRPVRFIRGHVPRKPHRYRIEDRGYVTPCWIWQLHINAGGYGMVGVGGSGNLAQAHRVAWEKANGAVPDGLQLDHLCRHRACVRPDHLEPVTQAENSQRGASARLTANDVKHVRVLLAARVPVAEIARRFNVVPGTVGHIKAGTSWRNVA